MAIILLLLISIRRFMLFELEYMVNGLPWSRYSITLRILEESAVGSFIIMYTNSQLHAQIMLGVGALHWHLLFLV